MNYSILQQPFAVEKSETVFSFFEEELPFTLPWSHYLQLMRIKDENERKFYEDRSDKCGMGDMDITNAI